MQELVANLTPKGLKTLDTPALVDLTTPVRSAPTPEEAGPSATTPVEAEVPFNLINTPNLSSLMSWSVDLPTLSTGTLQAWKSAMPGGAVLVTPLVFPL